MSNLNNKSESDLVNFDCKLKFDDKVSLQEAFAKSRKTTKASKPKKEKVKDTINKEGWEINPVTGKKIDELWDETLKLTQINLDLYGAARFGRELTGFRKANITGDHIKLFGDWYYRFHFAGLKNQIPTLSMILKSWPQFEQYLHDNPKILDSLTHDSLAKQDSSPIKQQTVNDRYNNLSGINSLISKIDANDKEMLQLLRRLT